MKVESPQSRVLHDLHVRDKRRSALRFDIVFPAHDEALRIGRTLGAYRSKIAHPSVRFLVALDGADDATAAVVRRHADEDRRVHLLQFPKLGKGGVLMEAFRRCDADLVGFVDADNATSPAELMRLAVAARSADGAIATRRHHASIVPAQRSALRKLCSVGFALCVRTVFRLPYSDTQCGAKVFKREVVQAALPFLSARDFLFDVDLLIVAESLGYQIVEVPTIWIDREGSKVRALVDARRMTVSTVRLWLHHRVLPVERPARTIRFEGVPAERGG